MQMLPKTNPSRPSRWRYLILGRRRRGGAAQLPNAPWNLLLQINPFDFTLNWNYASNTEEGFRVYRSSFGDPFIVVAEVPSNELFYTDAAVETGVIYTYYVVAFNASGESSHSNEVGGEIEIGA